MINKSLLSNEAKVTYQGAYQEKFMSMNCTISNQKCDLSKTTLPALFHLLDHLSREVARNVLAL